MKIKFIIIIVIVQLFMESFTFKIDDQQKITLEKRSASTVVKVAGKISKSAAMDEVIAMGSAFVMNSMGRNRVTKAVRDFLFDNESKKKKII